MMRGGRRLRDVKHPTLLLGSPAQREASSAGQTSFGEGQVRRTKLGPGHRSFVDGELLAQGEVLEGELAVAAEAEGEEAEQVE
jgi:hypothetical protein